MTVAHDLAPLTAHRNLRVLRDRDTDAGRVTVVVAVLRDDIDAARVCDLFDQLVHDPPKAIAAPPRGAITVGDLEMDLAGVHVRLSGGPDVALTYQEFRLLRTFMEHAGQVLTRRQLMRQAWDDATAVETRTIDVHVRRLRVKLAASTTRLATVRGFGYRFEAD
jgi:DNA-binding response OmpR family regulator